MPVSQQSERKYNHGEARRQPRTSLGFSGKLFIPEQGLEEDCHVVDFSPDGAGIRSANTAAVGTQVVLYVAGFGRYEGRVIQRDRLRIGIQFQSRAAKRARTAEMLAEYIANGTVNPAPLRSSMRTKEVPPMHQFTRADGQSENCEVIDIALGGAQLKTSARPEVGEVLHFGQTLAQVLRHTDEGFAVEFVTGEN